MVDVPPARRLWLPLVLLFVVPWVIYAALLIRQPDDRFAGWHNQVAWPATHFLTAAQGGLALPIFGHLMIGTVGALFVAMALLLVTRLLCRLLRVRDVSGAVAGATMILVPIYAFVFVKAVPTTVTVIDPQARQLVVQEFAALSRLPAVRTVVSGDELRALEVATYPHWDDGGLNVAMYAYTGADAPLLLAERDCGLRDVEACLTACDADLVELARWLGRSPAKADTSPGRHLLRLK